MKQILNYLPKLAILLLISSAGFSQNGQILLEFTGGLGPNQTAAIVGAGFGPRITNHVVTFDKDTVNNGVFSNQTTSPYPIQVSPAYSATISLQNQQYTGFTYGAGGSYPISSGLVFGAGPTPAAGAGIQQVTALNSFDLMGAWYAGNNGGPKNGMFMSDPRSTPVANYPGGSGTGLDAEGNQPGAANDVNNGVEIFTCTQRMYDLNTIHDSSHRYYYGDLVIKFNHFVHSPVIHFAGLGGSYRYCPTAGGNINDLSTWKSCFFSTELEYVQQNIPRTLTKMSGNQFFTISGNQITNSSATPNGDSYNIGTPPAGSFNDFGAATGSVRIGTLSNSPLDSLKFKIWLRGSNLTSPGFNWSVLGSQVIGGAKNPLTGDIWYVSASINESPSPLPVTGLSLSGTLNGSDATLNWKTITEINSKYFDIERSTDGRNYAVIGTKGAAGQSNFERSYSLVDPNIVSAINYYRVKEVDIDGKYVYSNVIAIRKPGSIRNVEVYPNPVTDRMNIVFSNAKGSYVIDLINAGGQLVGSGRVDISNDVQTMIMNKNSLASGTYFLRVKNTTNATEVYNQKVVIQ